MNTAVDSVALAAAASCTFVAVALRILFALRRLIRTLVYVVVAIAVTGISKPDILHTLLAFWVHR